MKEVLASAAGSQLRSGTAEWLSCIHDAEVTLTLWDNMYSKEEASKLLKELVYNELSVLQSRIEQMFQES